MMISGKYELLLTQECLERTGWEGLDEQLKRLTSSQLVNSSLQASVVNVWREGHSGTLCNHI